MSSASHLDENLEETEQSGLEKVILLLRAQTGHDFSLYKKSTLYRRIERRMGLLDLYNQLLNSLGYTVLVAENSEKTLALLLQHQSTFQLLLTDVIMPEMNGRQLAEKIRAILDE